MGHSRLRLRPLGGRPHLDLVLLAGYHGRESQEALQGGVSRHVQRHGGGLQLLPRVHQNTLERVTVFLVMLIAAGLFNAKMAATFGFIWIAARVIYSIGYYSGIPKNRIVGSFMGLALAEVPLLTMTSLQVGQLAKWWDIPQAF